MTDSVMQIPELYREVSGLKKELEFKFSISKMLTETLELKYDRLALDKKATEETIDHCYEMIVRTENTLVTASTSLYEEIGVLAKYHRDAEIKNEARFREQEARHAKEMSEMMQMMMQKMDMMEANHTEQMKSLLQFQNVFETDHGSENENLNECSSREESLVGVPDVEISEDSSEDSDDDLLSKEILKRRLKKYFNRWTTEMPIPELPIAESLSEMLYESYYPSL